MWLYQAANQAAKDAAKQVQEKAALVQEKAALVQAKVKENAEVLLNSISMQQTNPVDEIVYEELDDYKAFQDVFDLDIKTEEVATILKENQYVSDLHTAMVPEQLSYKEFWTRYYFREFSQKREEEERKKRDEALRQHLENEKALNDEREKEAKKAYEAQVLEERLAAEKAEDVQMWKDQVLQLQQVIRTLENGDSDKYRILCDDYEAKMAQMTLQIDEAKAVGYEEGIVESEDVISKMKVSVQREHEEVRACLEALLSDSAMPPLPASTILLADVAERIWGLRHKSALSTGAVEAAVSSFSSSSEQQEVARLKESMDSMAVAHQKEVDLWKARAIKMKKAKDECDAMLAQKDAAMEEATTKAFEEGKSTAQAELHATILALQAKVDALSKDLQQNETTPAKDSSTSHEKQEKDVTHSECTEDDQLQAPLERRGGDDWGEWD